MIADAVFVSGVLLLMHKIFREAMERVSPLLSRFCSWHNRRSAFLFSIIARWSFIKAVAACRGA
jgi:hypothetical protein